MQARNFRFHCGLVYVADPGYVYLDKYRIFPNYNYFQLHAPENIIFEFILVGSTYQNYN